LGDRRKYVKRENQSVVAVQLDLDNDGDIRTVDKETFARTYRKVGDGKYLKATPVWAECTVNEGRVQTKEGTTEYRQGDYLVFNDEHGNDGYAVAAEKFQSMYVRAD
jgi:hypothetical protein